MSAISPTGSTLVVDVVPSVATTATGVTPAARSRAMASRSAGADMRNSLSLGTRHRPSCPSPSRMTDLSTDECAWSEQ